MKTLLISHTDNDGISPVILLNLINVDFDYKLLETKELEDYMNLIIDNKLYLNYDQIYITDLSLSLDMCNKINNLEELKNKLLVFDHHQSNLFVNDYDFATVIVRNEIGRMECGTSLFYKYLKNKYNKEILDSEAVNNYVELVRENDTWDFLEDKEESARKLGMLFSIYNRDNYINKMIDNLKNGSSSIFTKEEEYLLEIEKIRMNDYIESKKDRVYFGSINEYRVGVVFAESYRSILGNYLSKYYADKVDFIIIINIDHGISYRTIKEVNVDEFAKIYGGGGHQKASGSPITDSFREELIKLLYEGINLDNVN